MKNAIVTQILPTSTDKIQIEFQQVIEKPTSDILGRLNKSDARFSQPKATRAWVTAEAKDAKEIFPALAPFIAEVVSTNAPASVPNLVLSVEGNNLNIQVTETHSVTENQLKNIAKVAKRRNSDTQKYLHADGKIIVSNKRVVTGPAKHTYIQHTGEELLSDLYAEYNEGIISLAEVAAVEMPSLTE